MYHQRELCLEFRKGNKMDKLTTYLPLPVHLKTEKSAEDLKQHKKNYYQKLTYRFEQVSDKDDVTDQVKASNWDQVERRSGNERRSKEKQRGKWLDSRIQKDRRQSQQSICVKI